MWYSLAHPPSYQKNSSKPEILWRTERFLYESFQLFQTKKFRWKVLILPTFYPETFSQADFFWKTAQKDSPKKIIGTVRQKFFDGKSWYSPFLFINLLANDNFPKHSTGLFAYDVIRYCETKKFWQKIVIISSSHPCYPKISSISEFFWNTEGFP